MIGFCPNCDKEQALSKISKQEELNIRGEKIVVQVELLKCSVCGEEFEDPLSRDDPLVTAYTEYRRRKGMVMPEQIYEFRKTYNLTQKEFSELVGIGIATLSRYENGSLQEEAHDKLLHFVMVPKNFLKLVEDDTTALIKDKKLSLVDRLCRELEESNHSLDKFVEQYGCYEASELSGFQTLNAEKLLNMVLFFCDKEGVYQTKLNKLLFYADFLNFKRQTVSISGARYARATHGPVPDKYKHFFAYIAEGNSAPIEETEQESYDFNGTLLVARESPKDDIFSNGEMKTLLDVKEFFKNFNTKEIRNFSHQEEGYQKTQNGQLISYRYANTLKI